MTRTISEVKSDGSYSTSDESGATSNDSEAKVHDSETIRNAFICSDDDIIVVCPFVVDCFMLFKIVFFTRLRYGREVAEEFGQAYETPEKLWSLATRVWKYALAPKGLVGKSSASGSKDPKPEIVLPF